MEYNAFRIDKNGGTVQYATIEEMLENSVPISSYLENSDNRSTTVEYTGFKVGNVPMKFAGYNTFMHPMNKNVNMSNYFVIENRTNTNGSYGAQSKGYSPLMNANSSDIYSGATIKLKYKGSGNDYTYGTLKVVRQNSDDTETELNTYTVPNVIFCMVQGAGGGGGKGGNYFYNGNPGGQGGMCGALSPIMLEMPYNATEFTEFLKITLGTGGNGGTSAGEPGDSGGSAIVELNGIQHIVATGGRGGLDGPKMNRFTSDMFNPNYSVWAVGADTLNMYNTIVGYAGSGRLTLCPNYTQKITYYWNNVYKDNNPYIRNVYGIPGHYQTYWAHFTTRVGSDSRLVWSMVDPNDYSQFRNTRSISDGVGDYSKFVKNYEEKYTDCPTSTANNGTKVITDPKGLAGASSYFGYGGVAETAGGLCAGGGGGNPNHSIWGGTGGNGAKGGDAAMQLFW